MSLHPPAFTVDKAVSARRGGAGHRPAGPAGGLRAAARHGAPRLAGGGAAPALAAPAPVRHGGTRRACGQQPILAGAIGQVGRFEVSTDDAYVKADSTAIAPKISGYIAAVPVERQPAGQGAARCWPASTTATSRSPRAGQGRGRSRPRPTSPTSRRRSLPSSRRSPRPRRPSTLDQANETFAEQDDKRYAELANKGYGTVQNAQQAASRIAAARAAVTRDIGRARQCRPSSSMCCKAELAQAQAALARAKAQAEDQAELNLSYATLVAPIDGRDRQPHAAGRPVCPGRHAADGGGADRPRPISSPTTRRPSSPTCVPASRSTSRSICSPGTVFTGPCRQPFAGERPGIRAAAARQRHRQLHQGRAAHPVKIVLDHDDARLPSCCGPACRSIRPSTPRPQRRGRLGRRTQSAERRQVVAPEDAQESAMSTITQTSTRFA